MQKHPAAAGLCPWCGAGAGSQGGGTRGALGTPRTGAAGNSVNSVVFSSGDLPGWSRNCARACEKTAVNGQEDNGDSAAIRPSGLLITENPAKR